MALDTYSDLVVEVADWLDDAGLASKADTFIRLAESRLNRILRTPEMETATTLSASAETVALPADFREVKALWVEGSPDAPLDGTSLSNLKALYGPADAQPVSYAIAGGSMWLGPSPAAATSLTLIYYQTIPALSASNPTNWLLAAHPDLYLWSCLLVAELRGWNDGRLPLLKSAADEAVMEIRSASAGQRYGGSPLRARSTSGAQIRAARS